MSDITRLSTLVYKLLGQFNVNSQSNITGVKLTKVDVNNAFAPNTLIEGSGVKKITVSATAPVSPEIGDLWIDIS